MATIDENWELLRRDWWQDLDDDSRRAPIDVFVHDLLTCLCSEVEVRTLDGRTLSLAEAEEVATRYTDVFMRTYRRRLGRLALQPGMKRYQDDHVAEQGEALGDSR